MARLAASPKRLSSLLPSPLGQRGRAHHAVHTKQEPTLLTSLPLLCRAVLAGRDRVAISSLMAVGRVHHHLVTLQKRSRVGLLLETAEAREVRVLRRGHSRHSMHSAQGASHASEIDAAGGEWGSGSKHCIMCW